MNDVSLCQTLIGFVRGIGIAVRCAPLGADCFLPGLDIGGGAVLVDETQLKYPGDILHEAGHLAVTAPEARGAPKLEPTPGDEMTAIAWSYAAALDLGIDPALVLHAHGYKGGGPAILENFTQGRYFGVPLLALYGMAVEPQRAIPGGPAPYPHMLRWLR